MVHLTPGSFMNSFNAARSLKVWRTKELPCACLPYDNGQLYGAGPRRTEVAQQCDSTCSGGSFAITALAGVLVPSFSSASISPRKSAAVCHRSAHLFYRHFMTALASRAGILGLQFTMGLGKSERLFTSVQQTEACREFITLGI